MNGTNNTLPDISLSMDLKDGQIGYGAKQYGYDGWGMAALAHHIAWVKLHFMKGADLSSLDEKGILQGKGKQLRHIRFTSPDGVKKMEGELKCLPEKATSLANS